MTTYLLIDFGTTSTKSALVDLDSGSFSHLQRHPSIPSAPATPGRHEVDLQAICQRFDEICAGYWKLTDPTGFKGILLCSEMHGFALLDERGRPLSPYVSWLDGRSLEEIDGISTFTEIVELLGPRFKEITGMRPRSGFPLMNLTHLIRQADDRPKRGYAVSLPGWIAAAAESQVSGRPEPTHKIGSPLQKEFRPPPEHPTLLAGMALFDTRAAALATELTEVVRALSGFELMLGEPAGTSTIAGHWHGPDAVIPIYAGVGDHQCSVLGSALAPSNAANINLGTGSQVAVIDRPVECDAVELRPYFDDSALSTITHIPAGRALSEFVGFLANVAGADDEEFWRRLAGLNESECADAPLQFDLSIFEGARNFKGGGSISGVLEGSLRLDNYLASLLNSFVDQYVQVLELLDPRGELTSCVLSGGIARNLPNLSGILTRRSGRSVAPATTLDESLLGLRTLALLADGRATSYSEAQQLFGRAGTLE